MNEKGLAIGQAILQISVICIVLFGPFNIAAQTLHDDWLDLYPLEFRDSLPSDISQTKSIAVVMEENIEELQALANKFHPIFRKSGIDVVSYYKVDDLFANHFITDELAEEFTKREVKYIVVVQKREGTFHLVITPFSGNSNFIEAGSKSWNMQSSEIAVISRAVYAQAYSLKRQNFLVSDVPEFPAPIFKLKGQRFEAYKPDLRTETLYVPLFAKTELDSTQQYDDEYRLTVKKHNTLITQKNIQIRAAMASYPLPYDFYNENDSEQDLAKNNIRYVVDVIHTSNRNIREILNYKEKVVGVTEYVTIRMQNGQGAIERIHYDEPVFKYYIKHLPSNSIYLGTKWDADRTWQDALQNHLGLLVNEIGQ